MTTSQPAATSVDVLLVGAGIMSSTLGMLLRQLDPSLSMILAEQRDEVAVESSNAWNNAGTGHAAWCELNYTPENSEGEISIQKALQINESFEISLQFWSFLVENKLLQDTASFIRPTPHLSFVWGEKNISFLRHRFEKLQKHHQFSKLEFSNDPEQIARWIPLAIQGRDKTEAVAATRYKYGADINFGALCKHMLGHLEKQQNFELCLKERVTDLQKHEQHGWLVHLKNTRTGDKRVIKTRFLFIGAGGGALPLLQKSAIPETRGYGGFPVSGQFLLCSNPQIVAQHEAKVYGKAPQGAPPMSVPHLDARHINGEKVLLFGPYAGFTSRFLKQGSPFDLIKSIKTDNILPMLAISRDSWPLIRYLIRQNLQTHQSRMRILREYYPLANDKDWKLHNAGQRVQIIKKDKQCGGKLVFGTEVVTATDGSISALLGASPGASTAVDAMISVIKTCFSERLKDPQWRNKMLEMIPSFGQSLIEDKALLEQIRKRNNAILGLSSKPR